MAVLPGTTIEISELKSGVSRQLFDGIFAAGGITLSQVSIMTGLEPHSIQNWVKRGFVSPPQKRQYSKEQFARIVTIHMLRDSLQIERVCSILSYINGTLNDEGDDLIRDSELYHRYVDMVARGGLSLSREAVSTAAREAAADYEEPTVGARDRLCKVLQMMAYAHYASLARRTAEDILAGLE